MKTLISLSLILLLGFEAHATKTVPNCHVQLDAKYKPTTKAVRGYAFDIDDNILNMPTKIMLFNKKTGAEEGISTAKFAEVRSHIGVSGEYKDYELRDDKKTGSLRFFGDEMDAKQNNFLKDLKKATGEANCDWQGPAWKAFARAMSFSSTAKSSSFITARLHSPETILEGLTYLKKLGYIKNVPSKENIFPVSYPKFHPRFASFNSGAANASNPSAKKSEVMLGLLDEIQKQAVPADAPMVIDQNGTGNARLHTWGFSDDDLGNYEKAVSVLTAEVAKNRWPNVKITLFYTGQNTSKLPEQKVIQLDGKLRDRKDEELHQN